jgi:hypothetical protein
MYLQFTSRCNMKCAHCCYSCGPKGRDMSKATLLKALDLCEEYGESPFIGGGEPTVHPKFWEFFGLILQRAGSYEMEGLGIITNGKNTKDALALAELGRRGLLSVELSRDRYHEPIEDRVVQAFTRKQASYGDRDVRDMRGIRSGSNASVLAVGRGAKISGSDKGCCCPDIVVDPEGRIWACGCKSRQLGTVDKPEIPEEVWENRGECWDYIQNKVKAEELDAEAQAIEEEELAEVNA